MRYISFSNSKKSCITFCFESFTKLSNTNARTITSGGHLSAVLSQLDLKDKIYHVSTAGGALIRYLTGEELPLLNALNNSANIHTK